MGRTNEELIYGGMILGQEECSWVVPIRRDLASSPGAWHKPRRGGAMRMPDFAIERGCAGLVCGVDEAGRGPLAGPVVAAAVILDRRRFRGLLRRELDDSKVLTRDTREVCC